MFSVGCFTTLVLRKMSHLLLDGFPQHFEYGAMLEVRPHTSTSMAVDWLSCLTSLFSFMFQSLLLIMRI